MKFKKISALILAIAMLAGLMVVPASAEAVTYYSVTGFAVPAFLSNFYDSSETIIGSAIDDTVAARHFVTDISGNTAEHETTGPGSVESIVDGSCVGTNGIALGVQLAWDATRRVIVDLGVARPVDKVDLYSGQEGSGGNTGAISSIKVYSADSSAGPWNYIMDITPGSGDGYAADNGWNRWFFQEGTFAETVNTRYIALEVEHSQNVLINQINVLSKTDPTPTVEKTTYYSVTGYNVPDVITEAYDRETTVIAAGSGSDLVNYTSTSATYHWIDDNGNTDIHENNTSYTGKVLNGGLAGIAAGELISWENARSIVVDLGKVQPVDKVDLQTAQSPGPNNNGVITSMRVYAKANETDDWTYIRDITPGTESFLSNGNYTWYYQEANFGSTVNARYIRIRIEHTMNVSVNYVAVLSKTAPAYTPSWGSALNVISNNTNNGQIVLPGDMINDYPELSGVTVTGSPTAAKYKWLAGETTIADESTRDEDGYVIPSENASYPYPDMQDGGYSDGDSKFNTTNWGTIAGTMLWDLGEEYTLSRFDILSNPSPNTYGWVKGARISISNDGVDFTPVIDKYSGAVNAYDNENTKISVYDLNGAKARYIKVEFIGDTAGKNTTVGEMFIYGTPSASVTGLMFTANGTNAIESYAAGALSAQATFNAAGGDLIVGWYDSTMKELKGVYKISGTGTKSIDLSSNDFEVGDKLKAFAFDSLSTIKSLATPAQVEVVSGE